MYRPKMRYAHQGGMNPPVIVIHGNRSTTSTMPTAASRGRFRGFDLVGTPLRIEFKTRPTLRRMILSCSGRHQTGRLWARHGHHLKLF